MVDKSLRRTGIKGAVKVIFEWMGRRGMMMSGSIFIFIFKLHFLALCAISTLSSPIPRARGRGRALMIPIALPKPLKEVLRANA